MQLGWKIRAFSESPFIDEWYKIQLFTGPRIDGESAISTRFRVRYGWLIFFLSSSIDAWFDYNYLVWDLAAVPFSSIIEAGSVYF